MEWNGQNKKDWGEGERVKQNKGMDVGKTKGWVWTKQGLGVGQTFCISIYRQEMENFDKNGTT